MQELISIIVPIYNTHDYLEECLNSLINQDYKILEILLVNDGSTDDSPEICKAFAAKDSRIKFFSKQNGGQAAARNYALDIMTGDYVAFIDSDDWIKPEYCSTLYNLAKQYNSDITGCEAFNNASINSGGGGIHVYSMQDYAKLLMPEKFTSHVIRKLFKAELFNSGEKVRFPENFRSVEDMGIFPYVLRKAAKVVITDSQLYFYRVHFGVTLSSTRQSPIGSIERALVFIDRYSMAADWVPDRIPHILKMAVWFGISSYAWLNADYAEEYAQNYETIRNFFVEHEQEIVDSPLIDKPRKIAARFIIRNHTWPFRIISPFRSVMKRIINRVQGR